MLRSAYTQVRQRAHSVRHVGTAVRTARAKRRRARQRYFDAPEITLILQCFNKAHQARRLFRSLRASGAEELIVIDDGSVDGSLRLWSRLLDRPNEFLLRCNDIYEVRTYDRALRFARGHLVCLLQDDDLPPTSPSWLLSARALFAAYPELAVLGGRVGMHVLPLDGQSGGPEARSRRVDGVEIARYLVDAGPRYRDPRTGLDFHHTCTVNRAPMILRREAVLALGGIDQAFAPFQCDDVDLCLRTWRAGYRVGLFDSGFRHYAVSGGMRDFNRDRVTPQAQRNWRQIYARYGADIAAGTFARRVADANALLQHHTAAASR